MRHHHHHHHTSFFPYIPLLQALAQAFFADADGTHAALAAGSLQLWYGQRVDALRQDLQIICAQLSQPVGQTEAQQVVGACACVKGRGENQIEDKYHG